jgi:hypothetical protein
LRDGIATKNPLALDDLQVADDEHVVKRDAAKACKLLLPELSSMSLM